MKRFKKVCLVAAACTLSAAVCVGLAACSGGGDKDIVGVYCYQGVNQGIRYSRESVNVQVLTLYGDDTYSLTTTVTAVTTDDVANETPWTAGFSTVLTVYGTYTTNNVVEEEGSYTTRDITLSDITRSVFAFNQIEAVQGSLDTILGDPDSYADYLPLYLPYTYVGDSDTFDAETKEAALESFNIKTKTLTVTDTSGIMSTGIAITIHGSAVLDDKLNNSNFS